MVKSVNSRAEEQFAAIQTKDKQAMKKKNKAEQVASLKALRLAKDAADKEAAEQEAAEKTAAKNKKP